MSDLIDLRKSYIKFSGEEKAWRSNLKSILYSEKSCCYLTKECLSEEIGKFPFSHPHRNEFLPIILDKKIYIFRSQSFKRKNIPLLEILENDNLLKFKEYIQRSKIIKFNALKMQRDIHSKKYKDLYIKIQFNQDKIEYELITKVEYINFNVKKSSNQYLQPIMGYVPMIYKKKLSYGYCVINILDGIEQNLQFLLNKDVNLFQTYQGDLIKKLLKKIFNYFTFLFRKTDFANLITIKNAKVTFFHI